MNLINNVRDSYLLDIKQGKATWKHTNANFYKDNESLFHFFFDVYMCSTMNLNLQRNVEKSFGTQQNYAFVQEENYLNLL